MSPVDLASAHLKEKGIFTLLAAVASVVWGLFATDPAILGMSVLLFYLSACTFLLLNQNIRGLLWGLLFLGGLISSYVGPLILVAKFAS